MSISSASNTAIRNFHACTLKARRNRSGALAVDIKRKFAAPHPVEMYDKLEVECLDCIVFLFIFLPKEIEIGETRLYI